MKNKKGDKIISVYWFAILFIVAAAIVYMAALFYGAPYDARGIESDILTNQIADCLSQGGYLKESISWDDNFKDKFLEECNLNFDVEDTYGWGAQEQYYVEVGLYEFNQDLEDGIGGEIFSFVEGNVNLKTFFILEQAEEERNKKEMVVVHFTAGYSATDAIETIIHNRLSVHYIIDREGNVLSINNADADEKDAFKSEDQTAQHVGCIDVRMEKIRNPCEGGGMPEPGEKCCVDLNRQSIGIELVNLGYVCNDSVACKEDRGTEISEEDWENYVAERYNDESMEGLIWEEFTEEQIDSLVYLVAGIVSRNNIPINRNYIVGHDEGAPGYKWDPGPAFPWEEFMNRLRDAEKLSPGMGRSFYVVDKNNKQYVIKIFAIVGKTEKNVA